MGRRRTIAPPPGCGVARPGGRLQQESLRLRADLNDRMDNTHCAEALAWIAAPGHQYGRVLPTPPAPVSVTRRERASSRLTSATSPRRPTQLVRSAGRFPTTRRLGAMTKPTLRHPLGMRNRSWPASRR
jgi:hypothetical protein